MPDQLPKVGAFSNWYGSARIVAKRIAGELKGCSFVGVPFAGSMSELKYISARTIKVGDLHLHLINMARVCAHPELGPQFYRHARRRLLHPIELQRAQQACIGRMELYESMPFEEAASHPPDLQWAIDYFVCTWMGQGGRSGMPKEFEQSMSHRWDAGGGGSVQRIQGAARDLPAWRKMFFRCEFVAMNCFKFIPHIADRLDPKTGERIHGIYCDPPWVGAGDKYTHKFSRDDHIRLCALLEERKHTRVVVRYGDDPFIRELYQAPHWNIVQLVSRNQDNKAVPEILILNGPSKVQNNVAQ